MTVLAKQNIQAMKKGRVRNVHLVGQGYPKQEASQAHKEQDNARHTVGVGVDE